MNRARHADLERALRTLWRVSPERDPRRFRAVLESLDAMLRLHMRHEEEVLLPVYAPLAAGLPPNDQPRVILRDHDLLRARLDALAARIEVPTAPDVLARADDLLALTDVLHHHDLREASGFLPTLERSVPEGQRRVWLQRFATEEAALPPVPELGPLPAPAPIVAELDPLDALRLAAAQDAPLDPSAVPVPAHPKGPRLHAHLVDLVRQTQRADLVGRRDLLVEVLTAARRLRIVT